MRLRRTSANGIRLAPRDPFPRVESLASRPGKDCTAKGSEVSARREEPDMRKLWAAMAITVASLALFEGCAPVPLPHYAAYKPRRVHELLVDSENLRQAGDDWERFWLLDQPSHLTPYRVHGGIFGGN
jgi:hypothetical protein